MIQATLIWPVTNAYEIAETQVRISSDSLEAEQKGNRDRTNVPDQTNQSQRLISISALQGHLHIAWTRHTVTSLDWESIWLSNYKKKDTHL